MKNITYKKLIELGFYFTIVSEQECGGNPFVYLCYDIAPGFSFITNECNLPYDYTEETKVELLNDFKFSVSFFSTDNIKFNDISDLTILIDLLNKNK